MLEEKIRVRAKEHAKVPFRAPEDGILVGWRFIGRARAWPHEALPDGEEIVINARNRADVERALRDGDLELVAPAAAAPEHDSDVAEAEEA